MSPYDSNLNWIGRMYERQEAHMIPFMCSTSFFSYTCFSSCVLLPSFLTHDSVHVFYFLLFFQFPVCGERIISQLNTTPCPAQGSRALISNCSLNTTQVRYPKYTLHIVHSEPLPGHTAISYCSLLTWVTATYRETGPWLLLLKILGIGTDHNDLMSGYRGHAILSRS